MQPKKHLTTTVDMDNGASVLRREVKGIKGNRDSKMLFRQASLSRGVAGNNGPGLKRWEIGTNLSIQMMLSRC